MADLLSGGHPIAILGLSARADTQPADTMAEMYSAQLLDHFENPRNAGDIAEPDAAAEMENPACGDILRLALSISEGRIAAAKFKAKGCVASIACGSALTELVLHQPVKEAHRLQRDDIAAAVGGLPQASTHAAQLAIDVLTATLRAIQS